MAGRCDWPMFHWPRPLSPTKIARSHGWKLRIPPHSSDSTLSGEDPRRSRGRAYRPSFDRRALRAETILISTGDGPDQGPKIPGLSTQFRRTKPFICRSAPTPRGTGGGCGGIALAFLQGLVAVTLVYRGEKFSVDLMTMCESICVTRCDYRGITVTRGSQGPTRPGKS